MSEPAESPLKIEKIEEPELIRRILRSLSGIDYGTVEITIQDSRVVQIERRQKSRFAQPLKIPPL